MNDQLASENATGASPDMVQNVFREISDELAKIIVGQQRVVTLLLGCLFSRGHCLLIGVPGLAKTLLVKSLADSLDLEFRRIQFTPDLMPADIVGSELLREHQGRLDFEYQRGPIFANLVLADEINRTPPKTQAALLEAMQERRVTVAGETNELPEPFLVVATQNPIEQEGTYPLPEAQLDRFMFSLRLDYPGKDDEVEIVRRTTITSTVNLIPRVDAETILQVQAFIEAAPVTEHVMDYAVNLARATRPAQPDAPDITREYVEWGAGPRASQYLIMGAKAVALLEGKLTPEVADVQSVMNEVLQHRVITNYRATGAGVKPDDILKELVQTVPQKAY